MKSYLQLDLHSQIEFDLLHWKCISVLLMPSPLENLLSLFCFSALDIGYQKPMCTQLCVSQETFLMDAYLSVSSKVNGVETGLVVRSKQKSAWEHISLPVNCHLSFGYKEEFENSLFHLKSVFVYFHIYAYTHIFGKVYFESSRKKNFPCFGNHFSLTENSRAWRIFVPQ